LNVKGVGGVSLLSAPCASFGEDCLGNRKPREWSIERRAYPVLVDGGFKDLGSIDHGNRFDGRFSVGRIYGDIWVHGSMCITWSSRLDRRGWIGRSCRIYDRLCN
jgi:hypothetical protein